MIEFSKSTCLGTIHRVLCNHSGLRPGGQLGVFSIPIIVLMQSSNLSIHYLRPDGNYAILYLARGLTDFLVLIFASWIMGRIERAKVVNTPFFSNARTCSLKGKWRG